MLGAGAKRNAIGGLPVQRRSLQSAWPVLVVAVLAVAVEFRHFKSSAAAQGSSCKAARSTTTETFTL